MNYQDKLEIERLQAMAKDLKGFVHDLTFRPNSLYLVGRLVEEPELLIRNYETMRFVLRPAAMGMYGVLLFTEAKARNVATEWNRMNPDNKVQFFMAKDFVRNELLKIEKKLQELQVEKV